MAPNTTEIWCWPSLPILFPPWASQFSFMRVLPLSPVSLPVPHRFSFPEGMAAGILVGTLFLHLPPAARLPRAYLPGKTTTHCTGPRESCRLEVVSRDPAILPPYFRLRSKALLWAGSLIRYFKSTFPEGCPEHPPSFLSPLSKSPSR